MDGQNWLLPAHSDVRELRELQGEARTRAATVHEAEGLYRTSSDAAEVGLGAMKASWRRKKRGPYKPQQGPPYVSCGDCSSGWVTRFDGTVVRCWCFLAHQQKLDSQAPAEGR